MYGDSDTYPLHTHVSAEFNHNSICVSRIVNPVCNKIKIEWNDSQFFIVCCPHHRHIQIHTHSHTQYKRMNRTSHLFPLVLLFSTFVRNWISSGTYTTHTHTIHSLPIGSISSHKIYLVTSSHYIYLMLLCAFVSLSVRLCLFIYLV